jgi:protein TonB
MLYKACTLSLFLLFTLVTCVKAQDSTGMVIPPNDSVYSVVDSLPRFPGGTDQFNLHIAKNIRYPVDCLVRGVHGRVFVQMIIEKDGSILNPLVIRSVNKELDLEAIRIIKTSPKWQPALVAGKPVRMYYTIPISFNMSVVDQNGRKLKNP